MYTLGGSYAITRMFQTLGWIILIILPCISATDTTTLDKNVERPTSTIQSSPFSIQPQLTKNNGELEQRLVQLESVLGEKLEILRNEARDIYSTLYGLRADLDTIVHQARSGPASLVQQSNPMFKSAEDLDKDVKMLMTAATSLTSDVNDLKKNVFSLITHTRFMLQSNSRFVTRDFLNQSISDQQPAPFLVSSETLISFPKDCWEVKQSGQTHTGKYIIRPKQTLQPLLVVCDMQTLGGGWTVIQNRFDGSEDFYQNWDYYKYGFGNLNGEFWLGLDTIHQLTGSQENELLIEIQFVDLRNGTAYYEKFSVGPEREGFSLNILEGYCGDAYDALTYHLGQKFSTKDVDQDASSGNCAVTHEGAWWYKSCYNSNLNGDYIEHMRWKISDKEEYKHLKSTRMLVRSRKEGVCDSF